MSLIALSARRPGRLPMVLLALTLSAGGCGQDDGETGSAEQGGDNAPSEVLIDDFTFIPEEIEVPAGTTVTWTNEDSAAHTVKDQGDLFPESESLAEGDEFSFSYNAPGDYPYICGIHPYMTGTVTVS